MIVAVLSDIHSNGDALDAVLESARTEGAASWWCLGDVVGYGANPRECLDIARSFRLTILGNHDQAALFDPEGFSPTAERAIFWTRDELESARERPEARHARWEFLAERPRTHRENGFQFVHGSARRSAKSSMNGT